CPRNWPSRCSCRWSAVAPKVADWAWRWRSRWRANIAARWPTGRGRGIPCSPCCCRSTTPARKERAMSDGTTVWVVDDDRGVRFVLATALREAGYTVRGFESAQGALRALGEGVPGLVFTDVRMPGEDGIALLRKLKAAHASVPVIVMSAYTDVASTAGAFRGGAWEFLSKPFDLDHAVALAARVLPAVDGTSGEPPARPAASTPPPQAATATDAVLVGDSAAMRAVFRSIGKLAQVPLSVLVTGETGTGKELVARALHRESPRSGKPFIALNTAAIPAELLESELFGHEAGAFTGASKRHVGRF